MDKKDPKPKTHCGNGHDLSVTRRLVACKTKKYYCIECQKTNTIRYRKIPENRQKVLEWTRTSNRRMRYGIEPDQFRYMLREQEERCAVCNEFLPLDEYKICVDHDHVTGQVRGLLCRTCNLGLGHLKDSIHCVKNAVKYLEQHRVL